MDAADQRLEGGPQPLGYRVRGAASNTDRLTCKQCTLRPDTKENAGPNRADFGFVDVDLDLISRTEKIAISRIDGNHRLHYGDGKEAKYESITKQVSFCLAYDLKNEEEIQLFKDINDNQKAMNTSHLDSIEVRLTESEMLKRRNPDLFIAQQLSRDSASPLSGKVYEGGTKVLGVDLPLRALRTGISYMLQRSVKLPELSDADAQYRVVRNFFSAVKKWQPKAWETPREFIVLRGAGLWAICFIGANVIDRALTDGKFRVDDMLMILQSGRSWNWSRTGDFKGYSGRAGALEISKKVTHHFHDESRISAKDLLKEIMQD